MKELEVKLSHDILDVKRDVAEMGKDIIIKLGSLVASLFALSGVIVAILFRFTH
jgi:hypothetical protein